MGRQPVLAPGSARAPAPTQVERVERVDLVELADLRRARDLIDRAYAEPLDVASIAAVAHCSPSHFARRYRTVFGETPYQHLINRRIERATVLLRSTTLTATDIAFAVGFGSLARFSARFTEIAGCSPTAYRDREPDLYPLPSCALKAARRSSRNRQA